MLVLDIKSGCLLCQGRVTYGRNKSHLTPLFLCFLALTGRHDRRRYRERCRRCPAVRYESSAGADGEVQVSARRTRRAPRGSRRLRVLYSPCCRKTLRSDFLTTHQLLKGVTVRTVFRAKAFSCLFQICSRWWHRFAVTERGAKPSLCSSWAWADGGVFIANCRLGKHCMYGSSRKGKTSCLGSFREIFSVTLLL